MEFSPGKACGEVDSPVLLIPQISGVFLSSERYSKFLQSETLADHILAM
jgi:hypothetical protein